MKKDTAGIIIAAIFSLLAAGCATAPVEADRVAEAKAADKPVTRPFSGVGSYGGYSYRRYD